jgi:hypothetical protein
MIIINEHGAYIKNSLSAIVKDTLKEITKMCSVNHAALSENEWKVCNKLYKFLRIYSLNLYDQALSKAFISSTTSVSTRNCCSCYANT